MEKSRNSIFYKKYKKYESADEAVGNVLCSIAKRIEASEDMKMRIDSRLDSLSVKEEHMKHFKVKKVIVGVAAACLVVGTVCVAGSGIKSYQMGGSAIPDYTKYSDLPKAEKEVGYEADAVEQFGNGYALKGIHINNMIITNEAGQQEAMQKDISIDYKKGNEDISLYIHKLAPSEDADAGMPAKGIGKTLKAGETEAVFTQITNKFVPPDYELTEEDKVNMEKDNFNLAYGSSEVEMKQGYSVLWIKDGIQYNLYGTDLSISADEMLNMAKEVIENGN